MTDETQSIKPHKKWHQSKGKIGGIIVMAIGGFVIAASLLKGSLGPDAALGALTTFGVGLGVFGIRDRQDGSK